MPHQSPTLRQSEQSSDGLGERYLSVAGQPPPLWGQWGSVSGHWPGGGRLAWMCWWYWEPQDCTHLCHNGLGQHRNDTYIQSGEFNYLQKEKKKKKSPLYQSWRVALRLGEVTSASQRWRWWEQSWWWNWEVRPCLQVVTEEAEEEDLFHIK